MIKNKPVAEINPEWATLALKLNALRDEANALGLFTTAQKLYDAAREINYEINYLAKRKAEREKV